MLIKEHMIHTVPAEFPHEPAQTLFHHRQIGVMTDSRFQADAVLARLIRIDFPRVEIKDTGLVIMLIDPAHRPA